MDNLLFYDIEVFKYDSLVVFKDIDNKVVAKFWNNGDPDYKADHGFSGISDLIKDKILVGYNNYNYDDYILSMMIERNPPSDYIKKLNDKIINEGTPTIPVSSKIHSIDTMQQIGTGRPSLKQIEGNMGRSIVESAVDFNIDRELTSEEKEIVERYCEYDVESTISIYKLRKKSYFDTKESLISMLPEESQKRVTRLNTTTISAAILTTDHKLIQWKRPKVPEDLWRNVPGIPDDVWQMWEELTSSMEAVTGRGKSKTIQALGCNIVFGLGGLHGAPKKGRVYENVELDDVGSMYPSAITMLDGLGDATELYDSMRKERLRIKHTDPVRASALKLVLNSVYGNFKNEHSKLHNPMASATVCIYGQIAIFALAQMLFDAGFEVININTDGVAFVSQPEKAEEHDRIKAAWEERFKGFVLETDHFDKWIQKDVNNYIATQGEHIKVKGGDVNKYDTNNYFANNNCRIVQIALVERLVHGTEPRETLVKNVDNPLLWQYVLKAGPTYDGTVNKNGEKMQNVNRVFAANEMFAAAHPDKITTLYKLRQDGGIVNYPDAPERMFLWNGDLEELQSVKEFFDFDHYMQIVKKKLEGWPDVY